MFPVRNDSPAARSSSVSSLNKPKPSVPAKPTKRKSVDEESVVSSDREALVPTKPSSEADSESKYLQIFSTFTTVYSTDFLVLVLKLILQNLNDL